MLNKPMYGWTDVQCGTEILGSASYLTDVPMDCLDAFITYFSQEYKSLGFSIEFDAEGYSFGLVEFAGSLYEMDTATNSNIPNIKEITPQMLNMGPYERPLEMLKGLGKELASDIENHLEDWAMWNPGDEEDKTEIEKRKDILREKCEKLKSLIQK